MLKLPGSSIRRLPVFGWPACLTQWTVWCGEVHREFGPTVNLLHCPEDNLLLTAVAPIQVGLPGPGVQVPKTQDNPEAVHPAALHGNGDPLQHIALHSECCVHLQEWTDLNMLAPGHGIAGIDAPSAVLIHPVLQAQGTTSHGADEPLAAPHQRGLAPGLDEAEAAKKDVDLGERPGHSARGQHNVGVLVLHQLGKVAEGAQGHAAAILVRVPPHPGLAAPGKVCEGSEDWLA
mmetsp:Transcript_62402/g.185905  ORF Transcript_62402/g.185905 Transcript_62402/m.185905 type:complete len:233 (-) Transcript_62402:160-858(-)